MEQNAEEMLTVKEVAEMTKLKPQAIYNYLYSRKLRALKHRPSGQWRIPRSAVEEMFEEHPTSEAILK